MFHLYDRANHNFSPSFAGARGWDEIRSGEMYWLMCVSNIIIFNSRALYIHESVIKYIR